MSDPNRFLSDEDELGHLAEDVGMSDQEFSEEAEIEDRSTGADPAAVPPPD
jgi:hypothetical protein